MKIKVVTRDEIRQIADIVGDDRLYAHFVKRINKEFDTADSERNSKVYVLFQENQGGKPVGFAVIGHSEAKMRVWGQIFRDEGWVDNNFVMQIPSFELMYMYVRPEYRRDGYGKILFDKILGFSKQNNISSIYAYVSDRTDTALRFYQKMNAKVIKDLSEEGIATAFINWQL